MRKNELLNKWLWKWHFIAGIISLPVIILLSITGVIYLFKSDYEVPRQKKITEVVIEETPISFQDQWEIVKSNAEKPINSMIIPIENSQSTEFISGRFSSKTSFYVNPYTGEFLGEINPKDSNMHSVRKLHGELLMGSFGTKIVELVASWMIVLIITGLYIWWPLKGWKLKGFFIPRTKLDKRIFFRDLHAVSSFWISILLLLILAGGLPWTDVFGENFKKIQEITNTGYPVTWKGIGIKSKGEGDIVSLDKMVEVANNLNLDGEITIGFPKGEKGVFVVSNQFFSNLESQKKLHFNQFTTELIHKDNWEDVGILMRGRMWVMAFHQGQFGNWNWWLMFIIAFVLFFASISAIISYVLRKRKGDLGIPKVPAKFKVGYGIVIILLILAMVFPLFGLSLIPIFIYEYFNKKKKSELNVK